MKKSLGSEKNMRVFNLIFDCLECQVLLEVELNEWIETRCKCFECGYENIIKLMMPYGDKG